MPARKRPLGLVLIVAYKAIWGLLEIATGVFVGWVPALLRRELAEDPQDQLANWLLAHAPLEPAQVRAAVVAFVALGALKILIAVGVWYGSWRVRDAALVVMTVAGVFAAVALAAHATPFRLVVVATDLLIVVYLWRYLPRYLPPRPSRVGAGAGATLVS